MISPRLPEHPRYRFLALLGQGGMGRVFHVEDRWDGVERALKLVPLGGDAERQRLADEIRLLSGLRHPGVVRTHDVGDIAGEFFFTMDLVRGSGLDAETGERPDRRGVARIGRIIADVLDTLSYVHSEGIVHGDIKPSNVRVFDDGTTGAPRVRSTSGWRDAAGRGAAKARERRSTWLPRSSTAQRRTSARTSTRSAPWRTT
jgi:serine/threonine protein kinase